MFTHKNYTINMVDQSNYYILIKIITNLGNNRIFLKFFYLLRRECNQLIRNMIKWVNILP